MVTGVDLFHHLERKEIIPRRTFLSQISSHLSLLLPHYPPSSLHLPLPHVPTGKQHLSIDVRGHHNIIVNQHQFLYSQPTNGREEGKKEREGSKN